MRDLQDIFHYHSSDNPAWFSFLWWNTITIEKQVREAWGGGGVKVQVMLTTFLLLHQEINTRFSGVWIKAKLRLVKNQESGGETAEGSNADDCDDNDHDN